ncbi:SRPBCC family protein [Nocardia inohanensis]|uniref:SRPBCC family protein n=1 Tax=Nocardia inohanensis TaxID=209246 RepID=UPI001FDFA42D|nr:SRPBCC domain-containing protein [Nocardia inohanensis]
MGIVAPAADVYAALTTVDGLAGWWTTDTRGKPGDIDGIIEFRFGPGGFDMKVVELDPDQRVRWEVVDGPEEWIGTFIDWNLSRTGEYTIVLFKHEGWREPVEFMYHCTTKWGVFLQSMKALVETGKGAPDPHDVKISDWH